MSAVPTFGEVRRKAIREKRTIVCFVMRFDDSIQRIQFGPRGGWKVAA